MKFIFIFILVLTNFLTYSFHYEINGYLSNFTFKQYLPGNAEPIVAEVELTTTCGLMTEAYVVVDLATNKVVPFKFRRTNIKTVEGNLLQVQLNKKFDAVTTNFEPKPAKKKVKMNLACENDSGLKDTFKSINDTFNN
ncbi:MAG: hypothetical protein OSB15_11730 [Amylibacter sp.]|nr:hypothetical protein [Amylibacter sp.]|tara:strand:+ start:489 stop:902 length:414 start_codon:yes stop_codon:yes gene_type:complete